MRSYVAAATLLCGSFFRFFEKSYLNFIFIKRVLMGGKQVPGWWVCGKLNGSGAGVKFSLRPDTPNRQALAAGLKNW